MVAELNKETFKPAIEGNDIVVVDFWAPWCGPCRSFAPVYEKVSQLYPDIHFTKVNTEEQQEIAGIFNIRSIPTLMIFRENIIVFNQAGALPESAFKQMLDQVKALDMDDVRKQVAAQKP